MYESVFFSAIDFNFKIFFKILFIYSWETQKRKERGREAETQAKGEAGSTQRTWRRTWSRVSRIRTWAEDGAKPLSPTWAAQDFTYFKDLS